MANERKFQKALVKELRERSFYVVEGAIAPGYPDLTCFRNQRYVMIEMKDLSDMSSKERIVTAFKRAQVPWMVAYQKTGNGPSFIAITYHESIYVYPIFTTHDAIALTTESVDRIINMSYVFSTVKELADWVESRTNEQD